MTRIVLIVAPTDCPKCRACLALAEALAAAHPGQVEIEVVSCESPEAVRYGVVLPPTMIVDDFIVAAGSVPRRQAVTRLVEQSLAEHAALEGDQP